MRLVINNKNYFALDTSELKSSNPSKNTTARTDEDIRMEELTGKVKDLLPKVREFVKNKDIVYASKIQAEYCVGYPCAVRILELLVKEGVLRKNKEVGYVVTK